MDAFAWLIIAACILIETGEQSLYRLSSGVSRWRCLPPAIALHATGLGLWLLLLRRVPLGVALPLMGANFVMIVVAGRLLFKESVTPRRWAGVALVVMGFALVAMDAR